jgi:hypothetical protein
MRRVAITASIAVLAAWSSLGTAVQAQTPQPPDRRVEQVVRSSTLPKVTVRVEPALPYLGRVEFDVNGRARVEQFFFAEVTDGTLGRTLVVHFEHFLPSNEFTFEYPTLRMITIGKRDYLHQTWAMPGLGLLQRPAVSELLATRGIRVEPDWFLNRYARVVDAAKKHELLIFYLEPARSAAVPFATLAAAGADPSGVPQGSGPWIDVARGVADRALRAFSVSDED